MQKFVIFEFFSLIVAQILMKFCRNFADNLENIEISEIFEFSRANSYLKEFEWFEWFEWFGPSPIEPFNPGGGSSPAASFAGPAAVGSVPGRAETSAAA